MGTGDVTDPIIAADHKRACLKRFEADTPAYEKLAHLLPEMLSLYDLIRSDARDRYNDTGKGKRGLGGSASSRAARSGRAVSR